MIDSQNQGTAVKEVTSTEFEFELAKFIPFRDSMEAKRVRAISRQAITKHSNPDFRIKVIDDSAKFYFEFALDIVRRLREKRERNETLVAIFPVGPMPQYAYAARLINELGINCEHLYSFNMDEYADENGNTAPATWAGSFQKAMLDNFFLKIDPALRPPESHIHFPTKDALPDYAAMIDDLGGADVCYGGIGWCGHIAFWEAHLGFEFENDFSAFKDAGPRLVELHPMTIMQNALHSFGGDWSWVPPKANTIGPRQILGARDRSFWLDGALGGGISWQRFIARLVAHGPVTPLVPGSVLQGVPGTYNILGSVADDVRIQMA
jgi:glucosamine-6-phosphate deaminase